MGFIPEELMEETEEELADFGFLWKIHTKLMHACMYVCIEKLRRREEVSTASDDKVIEPNTYVHLLILSHIHVHPTMIM